MENLALLDVTAGDMPQPQQQLAILCPTMHEDTALAVMDQARREAFPTLQRGGSLQCGQVNHVNYQIPSSHFVRGRDRG
jgi:hypothetical protein